MGEPNDLLCGDQAMNQPTARAPVIIPAQPTQLRLGDRTLSIPSQPMCQESRKRRDVQLVNDDPERMVLARSKRSQWARRFVAALLVTLSAALIACPWIIAVPALMDGAWWIGLPCILMSLFFLSVFVFFAIRHLFSAWPRRFHFDRRANQLTIDRPFGVRGEYRTEATDSLSAIVAVQLLYSGYHHISHSFDQGPTTHEQFYTYEMNLLFDHTEQSRLHLTTHSDWQWMRQAGQKLASFLGVPVVDQLYHGD
jgi:hypothetical protein